MSLLFTAPFGRAAGSEQIWFYTFAYDDIGNPVPITAIVTAYGSLSVNGTYTTLSSSTTNSSGLGSVTVPLDQYLYFNITDDFMTFYPNATTASNNPNVEYSGSATSYVILGSNINEGLSSSSPIQIDPNAKIFITSTTPNPVTATGWVKVINGDQNPTHYSVQVFWGDGQSAAPVSLTNPIIGSKSFTANWTAGPHNYSPGSYNLIAKFYHQQPGGKAYTTEASTGLTISIPSFTLTISTNPSGVTTIPGAGTYSQGTQVQLTAPGPVGIDSSNRYRFDHWTVDASAVAGNPITITMNAIHNAVANYVRQYLLTVNDGGHGTASGQNWYDSGTTATFSISPTTVGGTPGTQFLFSAWSGDSTATTPSATILMNAAHTVTAAWTTQYFLTVQSPYASTGGQGWYNAGSNAYATIDAGTVGGGTGIQYVFVSWSGGASGSGLTSNAIMMNAPVTATASWKTQYYLTVQSTYATTGGQGWYDASSDAYASVDSGIVSGGTGTQYVFLSWSNGASGTGLTSNAIAMGSPVTATASWKTQYYLTANNGGYGSTTGTGWYDSGASASFSITPTTISGSGSQVVFTDWSGDSSSSSASASVTMSAPKTVTANWKGQFYLTVNNGGFGVASGSAWYDSGSSATFSISPTTVPGSPGTRNVFASWSGDSSSSNSADSILMNGAKTVTATWKTQYYLTFNGSPSTIIPLPSIAWYDSGASLQSTAPPLATYSSMQYEFANWTVNGAGSTDHVLSITANSPATITVYYVEAALPDLAVSRSPEPVTYLDSPGFSASAFSHVGVLQVILSYNVNNGPFHNITMQLSNNLYSASLYPMRYGTTVDVKVYALDINGLATLYTSSFTVTDELPPTITGAAWTPVAPAFDQSVKVTTIITEPMNASGVDGVTLHWRLNGGAYASLPMQYDASTGNYYATIPGIPGGPATSVFAAILPAAYAASTSTVDFYIVGSDNAGNPATTRTYTYQVGGPTGTPALPSGLVPLLLLMAISYAILMRKRRSWTASPTK